MRDERLLLEGAAGKIETVINDPGAARRAIALVAHPHPLFGGTLDNKVAVTLARALFDCGAVVVRPNFRGVGNSEGVHDEGRGEADDLLAIVAWARETYGELPLVLAGFSFGGLVQLQVARRLACHQLILISPAVTRIEQQPPLPPATLVVQGDEDDVIPMQEVIAWAKPLQQPIVLLPGAGHFFHGRLTQLRDIVKAACRF